MISKYKYTDKEIDELVKSMVILYDTREQVNEHILQYFDKAQVNYKKKKLDYGDYSFYVPKNDGLNIPRDLYFDRDIIIERKSGLTELAGNLSEDRARLEKEIALSPKRKVLLIENATYEDVLKGNYRSNYGAKAMWATIHSWWERYDLPVMFMSDNKWSGYFIKGFFTYYLKEQLR